MDCLYFSVIGFFGGLSGWRVTLGPSQEIEEPGFYLALKRWLQAFEKYFQKFPCKITSVSLQSFGIGRPEHIRFNGSILQILLRPLSQCHKFTSKLRRMIIHDCCRISILPSLPSLHILLLLLFMQLNSFLSCVLLVINIMNFRSGNFPNKLFVHF